MALALPEHWETIALIVWVASSPIWWLAIWRGWFDGKRRKPDGYVGKFRRSDGQVVHVARLRDGKLMVASEERPGRIPRDMGTVSGPELARWEKLATTPDG